MPSYRPDLEYVLRQRQRDRENLESVQVAVIELYGEVPVHGAGYGTFDIVFPVRFVEEPLLTDGGRLAENQTIDVRNVPKIEVKVKEWTQTSGSPIYYTGAKLLVISEGPSNLRAVAHWSLKGKALRHPLEPTNAGLGG